MNDFPKRGDLPFYASHSTEFWTFFDSELSSPWLFHLSGLYLCKVGSGKDSTKCNLQCNAKALPCSSPMRINGVSNPDPATPSYMRGSASASCLPTLPPSLKLCASDPTPSPAKRFVQGQDSWAWAHFTRPMTSLKRSFSTWYEWVLIPGSLLLQSSQIIQPSLVST